MATATEPSFCRICPNCCPVLAKVEDGVLVEVTGDPSNEVFGGYTCIKGRTQPEFHNHQRRLLWSQKRLPSGEFVRISSVTAMDEIADQLSELIDRHGPRSIASYWGTAIMSNCLTEPFLSGFMAGIGSNMTFTPNTIDKPGKQIARALHGRWLAPLQGYDRPDVAMLIGANPFKSYYGIGGGNPATWLGAELKRGMDLIVIDPKRSDIAKRATIHLKPMPGKDALILAAFLNVIIGEALFDRAFVEENVSGFEELARAVKPFTPRLIAERADLQAEDIVRAARIFAKGSRGYIACGVGPGFSGGSTLIEYLTLNLETICGHWLRAGEKVTRNVTLLPSPNYKAQAMPPSRAYGFGERLRASGLTETAAGLPTAVLADEMLLDGQDRVRCLLSVAGNPVSAWPDQLKTLEALRSLDLLVQVDPWMSATAQVADYVIAPLMAYETPSMTLSNDFVISIPTYCGSAESYAQYTSAVVQPPQGSDVITEWEFFYGVARRMGTSIGLRPPSYESGGSLKPIPIDMNTAPSADEVLELLASGSRVALADVKRATHGALFPEPSAIVAEKDPDWSGRFDVANSDMLSDLENFGDDSLSQDEQLPFRLICQRLQNMMNSTLDDPVTNRGRGYNPAFMHPGDLELLGLSPGDAVVVFSSRAEIFAIAQEDANLRRGLVAMAHGFGGSPDRDDEFQTIGGPTNRLIDNTQFIDRYVGMPKLSNIPVGVRANSGIRTKSVARQ